VVGNDSFVGSKLSYLGIFNEVDLWASLVVYIVIAHLSIATYFISQLRPSQDKI
jgi:hypothetical protein